MAGQLFDTLMDANLPVGQRIAAARAEGELDQATALDDIRLFLDSTPPAVDAAENIEPEVDYRFLKIALIGYLYEQGDRSRGGDLLKHVREATGNPSSRNLETRGAANVIVEIADARLLRDVIAVGAEPGLRTAYNAVQTLEAMELPAPATGAPLTAFSGYPLPQEIEVKVGRLADYLGGVAQASEAKIVLSQELLAWLNSEDGTSYVIGNGEPEVVEPEDVLQDELPLYGLTYLYDEGYIRIVTMSEAIATWQSWWNALADDEGVRLATAGHYLVENRRALEESRAEREEMFDEEPAEDDGEPDDALEDAEP